ncbi:hypothetical protein WISP_80591 [Willisornis vidua]|uniref:Uncharacterized protein n=1 Tax=Willisornis vidua TaxID=1566151 RepID=A0ABQ9D4P1_9PASS|nr:hypothetical protein WISP_80591 [Willisornis vidua]
MRHLKILDLVSEKESMECSLSEAQQHVSQLEMVRSHLKGQVHTIMQIKEVMQENVKGLENQVEEWRSYKKQELADLDQELQSIEELSHITHRILEYAREEALQEKDREKTALFERLLQTQQQLEQLRQEMKEE